MDSCSSKLKEPRLEKSQSAVKLLPSELPGHTINKLPTNLLEMTINQLPALDQVAVSRVNSTFTELALKATAVMDVKDIPQEHRLEVLQKMCKGKDLSIVGLGSKPATEDMLFVESLAKVNRKIVRLRSSYYLRADRRRLVQNLPRVSEEE